MDGSTSSMESKKAHIGKSLCVLHPSGAPCLLKATMLSFLNDAVRGILLVVFLPFAIPLAFSDEARPLVGAIRWDAWQEGGTVQAAVEKTLGPNRWHYRLPFFAKVTGPDSVVIDGNTQAVMDQEINDAADAGIDYWAFCIYDDTIGMSNGLHLYLSSPVKNRINFALNLQSGHFVGKAGEREAEIARYVKYFKDTSYQKVLGNRPLVFLFGDLTPADKVQKSRVISDMLSQLRDASTAAGLGTPYIVFQGWNASDDFKTMQDYGLDAIGAYCIWHGSEEGQPFVSLAKRGRQIWESGKATGANVVPIVGSGWDNRPRFENPVPWTEGSPLHTLPPTPAELADHLADALDWTIRHRATVTPANTVLIYAWNENDEGGWLVPTLNPDGSINAERLDAIAGVLKADASHPAKESNRKDPVATAATSETATRMPPETKE